MAFLAPDEADSRPWKLMPCEFERHCVKYLHITGDGGVPGHRLWREVIVAIGPVEEGFPPLTVNKVSLENEPRSGACHGIQGTPSRWGAIVDVETARKEEKFNTTELTDLWATHMKKATTKELFCYLEISSSWTKPQLVIKLMASVPKHIRNLDNKKLQNEREAPL